jgi:hypothetical protein
MERSQNEIVFKNNLYLNKKINKNIYILIN